ncbi:hypothetical protein ACIPEP_15450 [Curtobacterium sp. NPDC087082]|uniref:hypothetical protein n=1 Tax=Curtobacterium sp. NPDC087082 TaxID=3363966 RepID=UPI0037FB0819
MSTVDEGSSGSPAPMPAVVKKQRKPALRQDDVPSVSLDDAVKVAQTIADNNAYKPTRPLSVADGMGMTPSSSNFRVVTGAAVAYGLTTGAYNAAEIGLTPLGMRVVRPTSEGDDLAAKREAVLKPRIVGEFLRHYDGAAFPVDSIARNVLVEKGVPAERADEVLELIVKGASAVGFFRDISGKRFIDLAGAADGEVGPEDGDGTPGPSKSVEQQAVATPSASGQSSPAHPTSPAVSISSGVNINIEIHIAADAETKTIEDIFRSMRRYVLKADEDQENDR